MTQLVCAVLLAGAVMPGRQQPFDIIIRNGTVIDGSGNPRYDADIGIRNGFIAAIGDLGEATAATHIDARGLLVTSGFIDIEEDLVKILQDPITSMACDCGASTATRVHPRFYGSYPRVLGRYVREQKIMTWEQAIRKSSWLPAAVRITGR